ncbi:caspase 20, apoptosis-related cysteine peptidase isoform X2 [Brachyhypopomus gauderio]|uniref:caspase 20, apoptosis-related cysteine peptidase isoform X2 n=1 Tax=Brachyhypopomus gauderio TaxID=698409 RepID=UPI0040436C3D
MFQWHLLHTVNYSRSQRSPHNIDAINTTTTLLNTTTITLMETLREKKLFFIDILSADASIVLQYAEQHGIITIREYRSLHHPNHTQENIIINFLDKLINKGEETCCSFLQLLLNKELQETFPQLQELFNPQPPAHTQISEYKISSTPRGLCVIINNVNFNPVFSDRKGSDVDEASLTEVFTWLGFSVKVHRDQSAQQMKTVLRDLAQRQHKGDCFICCILSHGSEEGVNGIDGDTVVFEDIYRPFTATSCPTLVNKPKVFFIQACRGKKIQGLVQIQADNLEVEEEEEKEEEEEEADFESDAVRFICIPDDGDFFVAQSTVKGFFSLRNPRSGSVFIQSLCKQLKAHCPKCEDIQSILLCVNEEVSRNLRKVTINSKVVTTTQMPVQKMTLRKKLVLHVPT